MKGKYCCFKCIAKDYTEKDLTDLCPTCGKSYEFPLKQKPDEIIADKGTAYTVNKSIGRGFYAVTYLCSKGNLATPTLLKVTPKKCYEVLKSFDKKEQTALDIFRLECCEHLDICEGTEHIVEIIDFFEADVHFGTENIPCFVSELKYINGPTFNEFIEKPENVNARNFAQLCVDLIKIWSELTEKKKYHNDLHGNNLIVELLDHTKVRRIDELSSSIKLKVIDLNSTNEESLSTTERQGDQTQIYNHLNKMTNILRNKIVNIDKVNDTDYRIISTLEKTARLLAPLSDRSRVPTPEELIQIIKNDFYSNLSYAPWESKFVLSRLDDGYNAQTIHKCFFPMLLVDPDNEWMNDISVSGPQLITGMRGCGKTTLLGSLDFHARANWYENQKENFTLLQNDAYIGISASCSNLIDNRGSGASDNYAKLIWIYAIELLGIIRHLKTIKENFVSVQYKSKIVEFLKSIININLEDAPLELEDADIESFLSYKMKDFSEGAGTKLTIAPKNAFESFSMLVMNLSELWKNKRVLFLLDDASTRYLRVETIKDLFTNLLFQSNTCSFKITTELQSVELMKLNSPGNVALAREGRDFTMYDFGAKVLEKIKKKNGRNNFLECILNKRIEHYMNHPQKSPKELLGDISLNDIAQNIASATTAKEQNQTYHGLSALTGVCVGDIGDVILLYDHIVRKYNNKTPISAIEQSDCFQNLCSGRLYNLNRRDDKLQQYAISFAEASHFLLVKSKKDYDKNYKLYLEDSVNNKKPTLRLRQYTSIHVRITTDEDKQRNQLSKLIELVDAGIFVFASGAPRAKNLGANPILQFKLAYRKLYGIASLIGLSDRDRFELSGVELDEWIENPNKDVLIRNLKGDDNYDDYDEIKPVEKKLQPKGEETQSIQLTLFDSNNSDSQIVLPKSNNSIHLVDSTYLHQRIQFKELKNNARKRVDLFITAFGFEDRIVNSTKKIISDWNINKTCIIEYKDKGRKDELLKVIYNLTNCQIYTENELNYIYEFIEQSESCLIDISGLSKPLIFLLINKVITSDKDLYIAYTEAAEYYPLIKTLEEKFERTKLLPRHKQFKEIMNNLLVGEKTIYELVPLIKESECYNTRPLTLFGFIISKNQRIFKILEDRDYAWAELFVSSGNSYRSKLAKMAADMVVSNYSHTDIVNLDQKNPQEIMDQLFDKYYHLYINQGTNIELGLTGTKWETVACAALSATEKIAQCWYVRPEIYDRNQFSIGAKNTIYYTVKKGAPL